MENTDNWNECFMPVVSSENNNESFFSKLKLVYLHLKFFTMKVSHQKQKKFLLSKTLF